jgi:hypothetical protein
MAKLHEELFVIKVSKLLKDSESAQPIMSPETVASLEAVIQELAGQSVLVEIATE